MTVQGLDNLKRQLRRVKKGVRPGLQKDAMPEGVKIVEREARRMAPVATGELRDKIDTEVLPARQSEAVVVLVSKAEHAMPVEFGTSDTPAQPYARPAIQSRKRDFWKTLKDWANGFLRRAGR